MPRQSPGLVDIVSGSFGAGHDAAAQAIASQLRALGYVTRTWDIVDLLPGRVGRALRATYLRQIQSAPTTWAWILRCSARREAMAGLIAGAMGYAAEPLLDIAAARPAAIISTHPLASQALGALRGDGRLAMPVVTYLTDMSVHRLWIHRSVDMHTGIHQLPAEEAKSLGAGLTRVVNPALSATFVAGRTSVRARTEYRRKLGLRLDARLALVTGGACGIGELAQTAADIADGGVAVPVVLCGRNTRLLRTMRSRSRIAVGWVDDMAALLGVVDAVVQNAGGSTSLEALACGLPVLTYRSVAGHGQSNADALDRAGLAPWVKQKSDLAASLHKVLSTQPVARPQIARRPDVVDAIFGESLRRSV